MGGGGVGTAAGVAGRGVRVGVDNLCSAMALVPIRSPQTHPRESLHPGETQSERVSHIMYNHLPESTGEEQQDALKQLFEKEQSFAGLRGRNFLLDNFIEDKSVKREKRGVGKKTARKHFEVIGEEADFNLYVPLHELWKQYVERELLENK